MNLWYILLYLKNLFHAYKLSQDTMGYFPLGVCVCALPTVCSLKLAPLNRSFLQAFWVLLFEFQHVITLLGTSLHKRRLQSHGL